MYYESVDAYRHVLPSLPKARRLVMEFILNNGRCTGREINRGLGSQSSHKRLSELHRLGIIRQAGTSICKVSGLRAASWECCPPGEIDPKVKLSAPPTRIELECDVIRLEAENDSLKKEVDRLRLLIQTVGLETEEQTALLFVN